MLKSHFQSLLVNSLAGCFLVMRMVVAQPSTTEPPLLQLGQSVERALEREQTHAYRFALAAGQMTQIVVEHHQQDIVVTLFDAAGKSLTEFDQEWRKEGREVVTHVAETAGVYRLEIKPKLKNALPGRYRIVQTELRAANEKDRLLQEAQYLYYQALGSFRFAMYKDAIPPLQRAVKLYESALGEEHLETARAINQLGVLTWRAVSGSRAAPLFQRAFELRKKLVGPETPEIADSLTYLGVVEWEQGRNDQA